MNNSMKKLFYIALGLLCWSCNNNDYEDIIGSSTPEKETRLNDPQFPDKSYILLNKYIVGMMDEGWAQTKKSAKENNRREFGFVINSVPTSTGEFALDIKYLLNGPVVEGTDAAQFPFKKIESNYCGLFHTHTPLTYVKGNFQRKTGPSQADKASTSNYLAPEFVYDYTMNYVYSGHPIDAAAKIYSYSVDRRLY